MRMTKHANAVLFSALLGLLPGTAASEVMLQDNSALLGAWLLKSVAPSLDRPKVEENRTWEFRDDGTIFISGYNRHFHTNDSATIQYHVEGGKILTEQPGRPGRYITYSVYEMTDTGMILKGGMEGFYFFEKK